MSDDGLTYEQALPLVEALAFYASPDSYHAVGFWFDRPCGGFSEDFTEDHGDAFYDRAMPGARARAALALAFPDPPHDAEMAAARDADRVARVAEGGGL